jgi:polysaccharide export outer membrane protein
MLRMWSLPDSVCNCCPYCYRITLPPTDSSSLRYGLLLKKLFCALLLALGLSSPSLCVAQATPDPSAITLQPGDLVRIAVWRRPEFSGDFVIAGDGTITHPLYRAINVTNVPLPQVEDHLRQFLKQYETDPAFSFSALLHIFVFGEVRQPNVLTVPPGTTVAQAIALSGGPTDEAKLGDVRLVRGVQTFAIDLMSPDPAMGRTTIRSGDQILVGRSKHVFRDVVGPVAAFIGLLVGIADIVVLVRR